MIQTDMQHFKRNGRVNARGGDLGSVTRIWQTTSVSNKRRNKEEFTVFNQNQTMTVDAELESRIGRGWGGKEVLQDRPPLEVSDS